MRWWKGCLNDRPAQGGRDLCQVRFHAANMRPNPLRCGSRWQQARWHPALRPPGEFDRGRRRRAIYVGWHHVSDRGKMNKGEMRVRFDRADRDRVSLWVAERIRPGFIKLPEMLTCFYWGKLIWPNISRNALLKVVINETMRCTLQNWGYFSQNWGYFSSPFQIALGFAPTTKCEAEI